MRLNWILSAAFVAAAATATAGVQSSQSMEKASKSDAMAMPTPMPMPMTYTGCVEAVNHGGTFLLTHAEQDMGRMEKPKMEKPKADMPGMQEMPSHAFILAGPDLAKHAGQTVSVTGSVMNNAMDTMRRDLSTLAFTRLKVVAKACSQDMHR